MDSTSIILVHKLSKAMSSNVVICQTNGPKLKYIQYNIIEDKLNWTIFTFLEAGIREI